MILALFALWCVAAGWWLTSTWRSQPTASRALVACWQLAALALVPGPGRILDQRPTLVPALLLLAAALGLFAVHLAASGQRRVAWAPWLVVYGVVLVVAMVASPSPGDAVVRTTRALVLLFLAAQTAHGLDPSTLRKLYAQFVVAAGAATMVGAVLVPDAAFRSIRAPVVRFQLLTPILGLPPHWTAAVGLGLLMVAARMDVLARIPTPGTTGGPTTRSALVVGAVGAALVALTSQRSFWLAAATGGMMWLALSRRRLLAPALVAAATLVAVFTLLQPARDLWDREQARPAVPHLASVRGAIFEASLERFEASPLVGQGLGVGNRGLLIELGQPGFEWSSHSEIGAALAATGVAGLVAVLWGHIVGLTASVRAWRIDGDPIPLTVVVAGLALLPFWRLLQEPLFVTLMTFVFVFPAHRWRSLALPGSTGGHR